MFQFDYEILYSKFVSLETIIGIVSHEELYNVVSPYSYYLIVKGQ